MKTRQLVETANVKGASRVLKNLIERTKPENVGLGLFYGHAGLGKTRWAQTTAIRNGYYYMQIVASHQRPKPFLTDLLCVLSNGVMPSGCGYDSVKVLFDKCLSIFQRDEELVLFIDEIDYAFKKDLILSIIRDFADLSLCTFVLIGMQSAKESLYRKNAHYFDRCNGFYQFRQISTEDLAVYLREVCEVEVDLPIVEYVAKKSNGTLRVVNKYVDALETIGAKLQKKALVYSEIKAVLKTLEN